MKLITSVKWFYAHRVSPANNSISSSSCKTISVATTFPLPFKIKHKMHYENGQKWTPGTFQYLLYFQLSNTNLYLWDFSIFFLSAICHNLICWQCNYSLKDVNASLLAFNIVCFYDQVRFFSLCNFWFMSPQQVLT